MMKANGLEVETSSLRGSFNELFKYPTKLSLTIKTDLDAGDNTWRIIDRDGKYRKRNSDPTKTVWLPNIPRK